MRCDQYQGLNKGARRLLNRVLKGATKSSTTTFADGRTVSTSNERVRACAKTEVIGYVRGFYKRHVGNRHRYTMHDGRVLEEFVEHKPWCGGPNYFIALRDVATGLVVPASSWKPEELKTYVG
jgi:hypothetical protein